MKHLYMLPNKRGTFILNRAGPNLYEISSFRFRTMPDLLEAMKIIIRDADKEHATINLIPLGYMLSEDIKSLFDLGFKQANAFTKQVIRKPDNQAAERPYDIQPAIEDFNGKVVFVNNDYKATMWLVRNVYGEPLHEYDNMGDARKALRLAKGQASLTW